MRQAYQIARRKTAKGKAASIHRWCLYVKEALHAPLPVSGLQPDPVANLDPGLGTDVRGADGVEPVEHDGSRVPDQGEGEAR